MASLKSSYAITLVITRLKLSIPLHRNGTFELYIVLHVSLKVMAFRRRQLAPWNAYLRRLEIEKKDSYLAILAYRTTPLKSCELSPSELCMSRRLRSNLPCTNERLKPQPLKLNDVRKKLSANREKQKKFHDRSAKHLSSLQKGDKVRVQIFDKLWKPAVITDQHSNRSYILQTHDGNVYRRNRKFIHKSKDQTREDSHLMPLLKSQEKSCELSGMPMSQAHSEITEPPQLITSR